ncbi:MAG: TPR repeat protein [Candidatus Tokpelaia hoelldobleri]|uniref:TPR repeat protein n=1 Tax=Candidatus Tokpelaia hoelldobleri TaxID=1902579 RepID=A0A1U9JWU8_9HYPH|nr:MAG: TPR repeat protein [Candidatus Tokpelaia hoelldoblerii]
MVALMISRLRLFLSLLLAMVCLAVEVPPLAGQGLPEIPPENDSKAPVLEPDDLIPERPEATDKTPEQAIPNDGRTAAARKAIELDRLFATLKRTANQEQAATIARQIQGLWAQSGSETVDFLLQSAETAIEDEDYALALDLLDNIVALKPDFAEGWMRRASLHIQMNDLTLAVIELNQALKYEPRHYNAMAQLGLVMEMTGRRNQALKAYYQALESYPQMLRVQKRIGTLEEETTGRAI